MRRKRSQKLVPLILALLSLGLMTVHARYPQAGEKLEGFFMVVLAPLVKGGYLARHVGEAGGGKGLSGENVHLREELVNLKQMVGGLQRFQADNEELRRLLGLRRQHPRGATRYVAVEVIGKDTSNWNRSLLIDRGSRKDIEKNMAVVSTRGLVGRISQASPFSSWVTLIVDENSRVAAVVERSGARGIVEGTGTDHCLLKYLPKGADVKVGDRVLSSGLGWVYPSDLLIGLVEELKEDSPGGIFLSAVVRPAVDFSQLWHGMVICEKTIPAKGLSGEGKSLSGGSRASGD